MKGSITKRVGKRGVTWQVVVDLPPDPVTGKRRQKFMTAPTKREAEALARKTISTIEIGGFAEADAKKITVGEYLTRWLASPAYEAEKRRRVLPLDE